MSVRAVVGSREEAQALEKRVASHASTSLEFAVVSPKDVKKPGAYNEALYGDSEPFDIIIHTVTSHMSEEADCLSRFINLETESLVNFLRSVTDIATNVRRVIITTFLSPFARWLVHPQPDWNSRGNTLSTQRPAEVDSEYVLTASRASDNIISDHLWRWIKDVNAGFDLVSITAPSIYGPSLRSINNSTDFEEANRRIWNICSNDGTDETTSPPYGIDYFTDVRDLAFAHVRAALIPEAGNKRFVVAAGTMPSRQVIRDFLVTRFPEIGSQIQPENFPPSRFMTGSIPPDTIDTAAAGTILGLVKYRSYEDTLTELARQILDLQRRREWRRIVQS
jgi:nucleoside-diphosphate-sugar epimerase